jgi:hypothetical protein
MSALQRPRSRLCSSAWRQEERCAAASASRLSGRADFPADLFRRTADARRSPRVAGPDLKRFNSGQIGRGKHAHLSTMDEALARQQFVGRPPSGKLGHAAEPGMNRRMGRGQIEARFVLGIGQVGDHRNVGDSRTIADDECSVPEVAIKIAEEILDAPQIVFQDLRIRGLREGPHEAVGRDIAGKLVIVPEQPAQDLVSLSSGLSPRNWAYRSASWRRMTAVCVRRLPFSSRTGISPISLTLARHSGVRVTPPPKSVQTGSKASPRASA